MGLHFTFLPCVDGAKLPDAVIPPGAVGWAEKVRGSSRGNMDAPMARRHHNISAAVILEDFLGWNVRIREQARHFALASRAVLQPLVGTRDYADPTYPTVKEQDAALGPPPLSFAHLARTEKPRTSLYGDGWDVIWLHHCGVQQPTGDHSGPGVSRRAAPRSEKRTSPSRCRVDLDSWDGAGHT